LPVSVRPDQTGIDSKGFPADQTFSDAALQYSLEDAAQQIALAEPTMPILRKRGMIGYVAIKPEPTEPPVSQVEVHFFAQASLRTDAEAVADNQHSDHQLGIDRGPAYTAVERRQLLSQITKLYKSIDRP
jgi:hypothetical protein